MKRHTKKPKVSPFESSNLAENRNRRKQCLTLSIHFGGHHANYHS
jgi:hypothetical protein